MFVTGVFDYLADVIDLLSPVLAVFGGDLLEGLLACLQGRLRGHGFFAGVDPVLRGFGEGVGKIPILIPPEVPNVQRPGQDCRNDEGLVDFVEDIGQQLVFLRIGHAVLNQPLAGAGVVGLAHVAGGRLVADALASPNEPLLQLDVAGGVGGLPLGVDHLDFIAYVHLLDHARGDGLPVVGVPGAGRGASPSNASSRDGPLDKD